MRGTVCGNRGICTSETGGGFRARMPGLGLRGCGGGEKRAEVLRPLLFELGLLFVARARGVWVCHQGCGCVIKGNYVYLY